MEKPKEVPRQVNTEKSLIAIVTNQRMAVHGLKELEDGMMGVVEILETFLSESGPTETTPIQTAFAKGTPVQVTPVQAASVNLEDVRAAAIELRNNGGRDALPGLIGKYGAAKLSAVKPEDLPALLADIKEHTNES